MKPFSGFANFLKRTNSTPVYRMGPNYVVQPSPGKGEGVFARRNLAPGTVILSDQATCKISKPGIHITEKDVLEAYQKLNTADQKRFMALHESHRLLNSKLLRIYKANCFRTNDDGTVLFLEISKFNHSCVPNASKEVEGDVANIVAKKPIMEGEEIFINYNPDFEGFTKFQRMAVTKAYFGFECDCSACSLEARDQQLSDWRRKLLLIISWNLKGMHTPDLSGLDALATMTSQEAEAQEVRRGFDIMPLAHPLPDQRKMAYWYLKARLLEAEGLVGVDVFTGYWQAYMALAKQIDACDVKLRPSLEFLQDLKHQCLRAIADTSGESSREFRTIKEAFDRLRGNESDFALGAVSHGMSCFDRVKLTFLSSALSANSSRCICSSPGKNGLHDNVQRFRRS